jgi:myo-inositol-1(or 4)-monophosphatase
VPETGIVHTLADLLPIAVEAVDRASRMIRERGPGHITIKGDRDPATEVDYAVEREIRAFLLESAPEVGFLGEEDGRFGDSASQFTWALDPVDGTVNFIQGIPLCGVSLGLISSVRPVLGVIDLPFLGSRYSAMLGAGAYHGDQRIHASTAANLKEAVVAIGDFATGEGSAEKNVDRLNITARLAATVERVRMFGSAATDLAWVAEGRLAASVILSNKPWDTVAGVLIAREAGAQVVDRYGEQHSLSSGSTIAAPPSLCGQIIELLN